MVLQQTGGSCDRNIKGLAKLSFQVSRILILLAYQQYSRALYELFKCVISAQRLSNKQSVPTFQLFFRLRRKRRCSNPNLGLPDVYKNQMND